MPAANVQRAGCAGWDCLTIYKRPTYVIMTYDPVNQTDHIVFVGFFSRILLLILPGVDGTRCYVIFP